MTDFLQIFDVDHGACALLTVQSPNGATPKRVMIDCGHSVRAGQRWSPGAYLKNAGIGHLDALVITNFDEDHASGAPDLLKHGIAVSHILGNPTVPAQVIEYLKTEDGMGTGIKLIATSIGERAERNATGSWPSLQGVEMHWCCNRYPVFEDENNLSLVLFLTIQGTTFMFPGDMERAGFLNLLKHRPDFRNLLPRVHVLEASHHGRRSGICEEIFDEHGCRPDLVIISDDYKQYDTQETTQYYASKAKGITGFRNQGKRWVLTTRSDGYLLFKFENGRCTVE